MRNKTACLKGFVAFLAVLAFLTFGSPVLAFQDIGRPSPEAMKGLYPGKTYSPYAQRSFPSRVYWGETHLHTGRRSTPDYSATNWATKRPTALHVAKR